MYQKAHVSAWTEIMYKHAAIIAYLKTEAW